MSQAGARRPCLLHTMASIAACTSSMPACATCASTAPVAGLRTGVHAPDAAGTHVPSISSPASGASRSAMPATSWVLDWALGDGYLELGDRILGIRAPHPQFLVSST